MSDVYLEFFQKVENGSLCNDYIVLISHSSFINDEEALLKAQQQLVGSDFLITKIEFPYIFCYKFKKLTEEVEKNE